jgi:hypothetical protein
MRIFAFILYILFVLNFGFAQSNTNKTSIVDRKSRQNETKNPLSDDWEGHVETIQERFADYKILFEVIGWSKTGLLAYRTRFYWPAMPGSGYALIIFNAVNDKIVETKNILTSSVDYDGPTKEEISKTRSEWNGTLRTYGIIGQVSNPVGEILDESYQTFGKENMECWFDYEVISNDEYYMDININWKLFVGIGKKQKLVSSDSDSFGLTYARKIKGYIKSPYENRMVILTLCVGRGYDDYTTWVEQFGCHLDVGFK